MLALIVMLVLAALPAAALQTATPTHAATYSTFTGTVVATPQQYEGQSHFTLLVQTGSNTVPVMANSRTQLVDSTNAPIKASDLHDRAQVSVTGTYSDSRFRATRIQDLSLPETVTIQLQAQLASPLPAPWQSSGPLCLANAHSTSYHRAMNLAPVANPCGNTLPLYLNGSTRLYNRAGDRVSLSALHRGDTVEVTASFGYGRFTASQVKDTSFYIHTSTLTGVLVSTPQIPSTPSNTQMLLQVDGRTVLVLVSPQTQIVNNDNTPISLSSLRDGDRLEVTGIYNSVQISASRVRDLSQSTPITLVIHGQIATPLPASGQTSGPLCVANATVTAIQPALTRAQLASICGNNLPVYLTGSTTILDRSGNALPLATLAVGDTVTITGATNLGQFTASQVQDSSQPLTLQLVGQVASPLPSYGQTAGPICVANAQGTGYQQQEIRALVVTPCGNNLALYLTNTTAVENNAGQAIALYSLRVNDNITFTATLVNGQLTASLLQDHSL
jgi:hypothetical protein